MQPQNPQHPQQPPQNPYPNPQQPPTAPNQMQPNQQQATPTYQQPPQPVASPSSNSAVDYLQSISTAEPTKKANSPLVLVIIIGIVLIIAVGVASLFLSSKPTNVSRMQSVYSRMEMLNGIIKKHHKKLRSSNLRKVNSSAKIFMENALRDIEKPLEINKIAVTKAAMLPQIVSADAKRETDLTESFEEARLNLNLDRVYARNMSYEISLLRTKMRETYQNTNSKSLKTFLEETDANMKPIADEFSTFSEASNISQPRDGS